MLAVSLVLPVLLVAALAGVVLLLIRLRGVQAALAWSRRRLESSVEESRSLRVTVAHQEANGFAWAAERDALRAAAEDLAFKIAELSEGLVEARVEREHLVAELNARSAELARVNDDQHFAWIGQVFSPYIGEIIPENAEVVERLAENLFQLGQTPASVEWYFKLAEACLRFADRDRADRASIALKELCPGDKRMAELRSRVLLHLGRISEAAAEKP